VPELIGARPPSALVAGVAGRGAEEGNGSTGVPITGSPGLGRQRSGVTSAMKVAGGGGGELWCVSLEAQKWGKEERGRSGGRRGCQGALLLGRRGSKAVGRRRGTGGGGGAS
jgi:hypothetical protein